MENTQTADNLDTGIKAGSLVVRLSSSRDEILLAQKLRYQVFYDEMGAKPTPDMAAAKLDIDPFDTYCDHLLVIDEARTDNKVVGTYRLIRRPVAEKHGQFYSASEFDITPLLDYPGEILELGRSCIHPDYRTRATMQILWKGLAAYISRYDIALMFGCGSLHGTDLSEHAQALSYLYYHHLAPPGLRPRALDGQYVDMRLLPREAFNPNTAFDTLKMDPRSGGNNLPPLIKGYLRVGAYVGDGAVIDQQFNTTDVLIIVKTDLITNRYTKHYDLPGNKKDIVLPS